MVKIRITNTVVVRNLPSNIKKKCIEDLTFENPVWKEAEKSGRYISIDTPPELLFYKTKGDKMKMPKGYFYFLKRRLIEYGCEYEIKDRTLTLPKIDFKFKGKLRDYQAEAAKDCLSYPCCVLEASTGSGKTVIGLFILARRKQPTIVVVHTKELLYQWIESCEKFLGVTPGVIGDGTFLVEPITIAIINSLKNKIDEVKDYFGHVIVDEVHRCPASIWTDTLKEFPAKFSLGLSATPFRRDGLGKAIYAFIGPKMHKVDSKRLQKEGAVLKPRIIPINTNFMFDFKANYSSMIAGLTKNRQRNRQIANAVKSDWKANRDNILIVSDRVTHCRFIQEELKELGIKSELVHGKIKGKERKRIIQDVKDGKVRVLIATLSLIGEGFDAPNLTVLFLTTPIKFSGRLIQTVGRVLRPEKGKQPRVYDVVDARVPILRYSWFSRNKVYKKEWS